MDKYCKVVIIVIVVLMLLAAITAAAVAIQAIRNYLPLIYNPPLPTHAPTMDPGAEPTYPAPITPPP